MEAKGTAIFWVVLSILVCIFGTFMMQLRENVAETNRVLKHTEDRFTNEMTDFKNKIKQDIKKRLDKLETDYGSEIKMLKNSADGSSGGKLGEKMRKAMESNQQEIEKLAKTTQNQIKILDRKISSGAKGPGADGGPQIPTATNCQDHLKAGHTKDGVYRIVDPTGNLPEGLSVYCDMTYNYGSGGWIVMQRRSDPTMTFDRNWRDYVDGFGDPAKDFWMGNKYLRAMTAEVLHELRIDMWDKSGEHRHAIYVDFRVAPEEENFAISFGQYTGNAGNSFQSHQNVPFSTYDKDNDKFADGSCADMWKNGWWFTDCYMASLNGKPGKPSWDGLKWQEWHWKDDPAIAKVEMKIRPMVI